jgi:SWI/SNF-related matrix-associated actin-dependent regulator 1 of chromatin subfamily A
MRSWSFDFGEYNDLIKALTPIKHVTMDKFKDFTIKQLTQPREEPNEQCLQQIEPELVSTLLDFQREGVAFGVSRGGRCLIADDMGLGKSRQALGIAEYYRDDWPLLIVTNASTREFWAKEVTDLLPKVLFHELRIIQNQNDILDREKIVICSYANLQQQSVSTLTDMDFGVIIFDESHNLKNMVSSRCCCCFPLF